MSNLDQTIRACVREEIQRILPEMLAEFTAGKDDDFIDTRAAAELTGLSVQFFECGRSLNKPGIPRYYKIGRRVLYSRAELIEWMRHRREA